MANKPKYVVLEQDLPAKYAASLLGLVVTDVRRPLDEYEPITLSGKEPDSLPLVKKYMLEPKLEKDVTIRPNRVRRHRARLALLQFFGLDGLMGTREAYELKSKSVVTYEVQRYPKLMEELMQQHGDEVTGLMGRASAQGGVFMVIGCKTASNATVQHGNAGTSSARGTGKVIAPDPVSGGGATQSVPVAEGEVSTEHSWSSIVAGTATGQRVFAAEYCEIRWKKTGFDLGPPGVVKFKKVVRNKGIKTYGSEALSFGGEPDELSSSDDDEHDYNSEDNFM